MTTTPLVTSGQDSSNRQTPTSLGDLKLWVLAQLRALRVNGYTRTVTASYTVLMGDYAILCDASSAALTVTLPSALGVRSQVFHIKKVDSSGHSVTIVCYGSETLDGLASQSTSTQYESISVVSDGANWYIV